MCALASQTPSPFSLATGAPHVQGFLAWRWEGLSLSFPPSLAPLSLSVFLTFFTLAASNGTHLHECCLQTIRLASSVNHACNEVTS